MTNEDNTRQLNQPNGEVLSAIKDLDGRLTTVEEIILARLNDTRPFEHQMMERFNEFAATQTAILEAIAGIHEEQAAMREEQAAMRQEQAAMRQDLNQFRQETNHNFRLVNQMLGHLNDDFLRIRAEHTLLEKRVDVLEARAA